MLSLPDAPPQFGEIAADEPRRHTLEAVDQLRQTVAIGFELGVVATRVVEMADREITRETLAADVDPL